MMKLLFYLSILFLTLPFNILADTYPPDKAALLELKASVVDNGGMLEGWDDYTDPCLDQWNGISCTCAPMWEQLDGEEEAEPCLPIDPAYTYQGSRVLQLNLGDVRNTQWNVLAGNLPTAIGSLTGLRILNLKGNNFTGSIPSTFSKLMSLEQLILADNDITGALPSYLHTFKRLQYVFLENNNLEGPLPVEWCSGAYWYFDVRNNSGLCDEVPYCLYDRVLSWEGTSLIDPISDADRGQGGYCGVAPATCRREEEACWVQVPDPPYWTDPTKVTFSFPIFPSTEGGVSTTYDWCLGLKPRTCDITNWTAFKGKSFSQSAEVVGEYGGGKEVVSQTVYRADGALPEGQSLRQGAKYYVTVRGTNAGGPLNALTVVSDPVTVDATPPSLPAGNGVYSSQYYSNSPAQTNTNGIGVSWDAFEDPDSGIKNYAYQVFEYVPNKERGSGVTNYIGPSKSNKVQIKDVNTRNLFISKLTLEVGKQYFVRVYATNGAGMEAFQDGPPLSVLNPGEGLIVANNTVGLDASQVAIIVAVLVGATSAAVAVVTFYLARERYRKRQQQSRKYRGQMKNVRQLLNSLVERVGTTDKGYNLEELRQLRNVAFVITDLESSTKIASAAPRAYEWVQEAHDALLRDLIAAHGGYEINTEGDAFHVAFQSVTTAVHFCMDVQYQMMEIEWPREVLKLPECREVRAPDGGWVFRGPRLRMGIHWAEEGSVLQHIHTLTKHRVFTGPAFQITRDLCEVADGGQVLLTQAVWERLREDMPAAAFPVVEQLGNFKFPSWAEPIWVYQVTKLLGRPLYRQPASLGSGSSTASAPIERIAGGAGLSIMIAPTPRTTRGDIAFVSCRIATESAVGLHSSGTANGIAINVPEALHLKVYENLAAAAIQYSGFIFRMSETQGCYLVAFSSTVDAVRFAHTAQVLLMYSTWPAEAVEWCGEEDSAADGKPLFKGPRIAMAIHESNDYSTRPVPRALPSPDRPNTLTDYLGPAEEIARVLSEVAHGGQVVLSEPAWKSVQDQLPGQPQVISLGTHALQEPCLPGPAMLMEVMPQVLAKRSFGAPRKAQMVEPGYRDAPSAQSEVAIAQIRIVKPRVVAAAEAAGAGAGNDSIIRTITAYNLGLTRAVRAARSLLRAHNGYECKEPEPGKLTVAFTSLDAAVRWAGAMQRALLTVHWPQELLDWEECKETREGEGEEDDMTEDGGILTSAPPPAPQIGGYHKHNTATAPVASYLDSIAVLSGIDGMDGEYASVAASGLSIGGALLWRGLSARVGIACGVPTSKAPLNTGRADYFGTIPNLAARLMSLAQPGQILLDGARLNTLKNLRWRDDTAVLPGNDAFPEALEVTTLGQFAVKGLEELRTVYQALPVGLQGRAFNDSPALVRPSGLSVSRRVASQRRVVAEGAVDTTALHIAGGPHTTGIFSSISRNNSQTSGDRKKGGGLGLFRTASRSSDTSVDGAHAYFTRNSHMNTSTTSSGGGTGWFGKAKGRGPTSNDDSSHHDIYTNAVLETSPKSVATSADTNPYVTVAVPITSGGAGNSTARSSSSFNTDSHDISTLPVSQIVAAGDVPQSIRNISQWSYPSNPPSHTGTPTHAVSTSAGMTVDPWDAGMAVESSLKKDGLDFGDIKKCDDASPCGSAALDAVEGGDWNGSASGSFTSRLLHGRNIGKIKVKSRESLPSSLLSREEGKGGAGLWASLSKKASSNGKNK